MESIKLNLIPFPPSVNSAYAHFRDRSGTIRRCKSPAVLDWNGKFYAWELVNRHEVRNAKNLLQTLNGLIGMKFAFRMSKQRLFTLKGTPKKLDLSNHIKILEDSITGLLGFDDSLVFKLEAEKIPHEKKSSWVDLEIFSL